MLPEQKARRDGRWEGPAKVFLPVSVRRDLGFSFVGSPAGHEDAEGCNAEDVERGHIMIDARTKKTK